MYPDRLQDPQCCGARTLSCTTTIEFSENFGADWHPYYGDRLAMFPRSVVLRDSTQDGATSYWPDFATLIDDDAARQIAYYPTECSSRSLRLLFDKHLGGLDLWIYEDDRVIRLHSVPNPVENALRAAELH
jgi:hypothetical protein